MLFKLVTGKEYEWTLKPVQDGTTMKQYLLDPETNFVYSQIRPTDWPQVHLYLEHYVRCLRPPCFALHDSP